jgi:hypothetical protein
MKKFEYHSMELIYESPQQMAQILTEEAGKKGLELVSMQPVETAPYTAGPKQRLFLCVFKKEIQE